MNRGKQVLSKEEYGSVVKCNSGIYHVTIYGVTMHFNEDAYLNFSRMIEKAHSNYMDLSFQALIDEEG